MSKTFCKYHQSVPARWHCPACRLDLCPQCVKKGETNSHDRVCFSCHGEVDSLGVGNTISPFWERIPKFFVYPARIDSLMYLGMLSLASVIVFVPLFGILLYLAISYAILKYELLQTGIAENAGKTAQSLLSLSDPNLDWVGLAGGMGVPAGRATSAETFYQELEKGIAIKGPYLIEATIKPIL